MTILQLVKDRLRPRRRVVLFGPAPVTVPTGVRLLSRNREFREAFIEASEFVEARRGWSLWREIDNDLPPEGVTSSERNFVQEVVLQLALFRALEATGAEYEAVAGISLGDGAALYASGALTFEETLHVTCEMIRAVLCASGGDLVAVRAAPARVREIAENPGVKLIFDWPVLSVWAVPDAAAPPMLRQLRSAGVAYTRLGFNCLSHTERVDSASLRNSLSSLRPRQPTHLLYSTLEGGPVTDNEMAERCVRIISEPARLETMWNAMREGGYTEIIYIGSVAADKDLFRSLPRSARPSSYTRAESLIPVGDGSGSPVVAVNEARTTISAAIRSSAFAQDPYPYYRQWLTEGPVQKIAGQPVYAVLGYDAASTVLKQPELFSSKPFEHLSPTLLGADAPDHTRTRRLLTPFFSREQQMAQADSIMSTTARAIERLRRLGTFDAVADFGAGLPFSIACEWLGLHEQDAGTLALLAPIEVTWPDVERAMKPDGVVARIAGSGELTRNEIQLLMPFLIAAGLTTTRDLLLLSMHTLLRERELLEEIGATPALVSPFVEELLRYEPPVHGLVRRARTDATVGEIDIAADSLIWVFLAAANRDPGKFDRPDEFIVGREGPRHLSFGNGPHFCMGNHLGRMEVEVIVRALLPELARIKPVSPPDFMLTDIRDNLPWMREMRSWKLSYMRG